MADWDQDSPQLRQNLTRLLRDIRDDALRRAPLSLEVIKTWHYRMMRNVAVPSETYVGRFRGQPGLEDVTVRVGTQFGVHPSRVASQLRTFERKLAKGIKELDGLYPLASDLDEDGLAAVLDLAAWAHAEWIRIHPFVNGNGRTARLLANAIFMRYGLPPAIRLRPRLGGGYSNAGAAAMLGDWRPTAEVFRELLNELLK